MSDLDWRPLGEDNRPGNRARRPSDILAVGDVIHVKEVVEDGEFRNWSLRQIPEVQGAFMAMDVNSGRVLAMQGGFSYQQSSFNRATQAMRQPGSAFKPFVYASALDSGYYPSTILIDAPFEIETPEGIWQPKNYSGEYFGPAPMRIGIIKSRNLMTVRLANDVGMDVVADYAERFGVYDRMEPYLANSLGAKETTLFRMVAAYAMFANGGERVEPTLVDRVQDRWGRTIYRHDSRDCTGCGATDLEPRNRPHHNQRTTEDHGPGDGLPVDVDDGRRGPFRDGAGEPSTSRFRPRERPERQMNRRMSGTSASIRTSSRDVMSVSTSRAASAGMPPDPDFARRCSTPSWRRLPKCSGHRISRFRPMASSSSSTG